MSATNTMTPPLVSNDIDAMCMAEDVRFLRGRDGTSTIELCLPNPAVDDDQRVYTAQQQRLFPHVDTFGSRHRIIAISSSLIYYTNGGELLPEHTQHAQCRYVISYALGHAEWRTVIQAVKPGDVVGLRWKAGNDYPAITKVGLHRDELRLVLNRGQSSPVFLVDAVVCANNTARMIRL